MKFCDALNEFRGEQLWCSTHDLAADHLSENGDDWVCSAYAVAEGCNCCPKNHNRGEKNQKLYKAAWNRLSPEEQAALKRQLEAEDK